MLGELAQFVEVEAQRLADPALDDEAIERGFEGIEGDLGLGEGLVDGQALGPDRG